jgi:GTP-binding protein
MKLAARFVTSAADAKDFPPETTPEVAIVGRSNVGKSSVINAMLGSPLARTSRTPGRTRLLNWFDVDARPKLRLVDLPGYGYAEVSVAMRASWRPLIETYLTTRSVLAGVVLLIDARRGVQDEELDFAPWLAERGTAMVVALTKADKLSKHERPLEVAKAKRALDLRRPPVAVSALTGDGVEELWRAVIAVAAAGAPPRSSPP